MNRRLMIVVCSVSVAACIGCKSTHTTASQPVAGTGAAKRIYDTSYIPPSLWSKVDPNGKGSIGKPFVVSEVAVDGTYIYEVVKDGVANYYDVHGVELTGADRTRIVSHIKALR